MIYLAQSLLTLAAFLWSHCRTSLASLTRDRMREPRAAVPRWKVPVWRMAWARVGGEPWKGGELWEGGEPWKGGELVEGGKL